MPGHAVPEPETAKVKEEVRRLDELIASHDAVFIGTDSRYGRENRSH
jgi:hypothetical protein